MWRNSLILTINKFNKYSNKKKNCAVLQNKYFQKDSFLREEEISDGANSLGDQPRNFWGDLLAKFLREPSIWLLKINLLAKVFIVQFHVWGPWPSWPYFAATGRNKTTSADIAMKRYLSRLFSDSKLKN